MDPRDSDDEAAKSKETENPLAASTSIQYHTNATMDFHNSFEREMELFRREKELLERERAFLQRASTSRNVMEPQYLNAWATRCQNLIQVVEHP